MLALPSPARSPEQRSIWPRRVGRARQPVKGKNRKKLSRSALQIDQSLRTAEFRLMRNPYNATLTN